MRFYGIEKFDKKNKFFERYYSNEHGINSRLDEIHSGILNFKLRKVKDFINRRKKIAKMYLNGLKNTKLKLPQIKKGYEHVFHLFTVYHPKRAKLLDI